MTTSPIMNVTEELLAELEDAATTAGGNTWIVGALESGRSAVDTETGRQVTGWIDPEDAAHMIAANPATVLALIARIREREREKDAARYQWLRSRSTGPATIWELVSDDAQPPYMTLKAEAELDEAIDAAMASPPKEET